MSGCRDKAWWYWPASGVLLLGAVAGCGLSLAAFLLPTLVQVAHYRWRVGSLTAFAVQARIGYLRWSLAGLWGPLEPLRWIQLAGTTAMVTVDYCPMARLVALMPSNRDRPLSLRLIWRSFWSAPGPGSVIERARAA